MATYELLKILLSESRLKRLDNSEEWKSVETSISTGYKEAEDTGIISVLVGVELNFKNADDKTFLNAFVQMFGAFEPSEKNPEGLDTFATINAPAILYPFVREHIHSLTSKSGIDFLLPPFNFVEYAKKKKAEKEQQA